MKTRPNVATVVCISFHLIAMAGLQHVEAQTLSNHVIFETGDLPIILSAPHGGNELIPGALPRKGIGVRSFSNTMDFGTKKLALQTAGALERQTGKRPYIVVASFHRKFVDANRSEERAYESEESARAYHAYHEALSQARQDVIHRWGRGLLLDIHGQSEVPDAILRGTVNGRTTTHLVSRFGLESLIGDRSLLGQIAQQALSVVPEVDSAEREHSAYNGGFIVSKYGSGKGGTMDAIQLEVGRNLRSFDARPAVAEKMANAIASFAQEYMPSEEQSVQQTQQTSTRQPFETTETHSNRKNASVFADRFTDSDRDGWFELDDDSSTLSVKSRSGQMGSSSELSFSATDESSLKSFAAHFDEVTLQRTGDFIKLRFNARHNHSGFINRGFRFGLFHSSGTRFTDDGDQDSEPVSLDDRGYFVMLDLGINTTFDSAVIRETNNFTDERLANGGLIAFDAPDKNRDPLMFTREKNYTYSLTLTRNSRGTIDVSLQNNVTGDEDALTGTSTLSPTLAFDTLYFGITGSTADFAIDDVRITDNRTASHRAAEKPINIGVYVDEGAGPSVNDLLFVLGKYEDVSIKRLTAYDVQSGQLDGLDLLMLPGGSGRGQGRTLGETGRASIRKFVREGGGFIGICAGAYLASSHYPWSLHILDAMVVDTEHWNRGTGTVDIAISDWGRQLLQTEERMLPIHYAQGPLLAPGNQPDIDDYQPIAKFETEIAKKGAPQGVMRGTTAIAEGRFGQGRVVCFSAHPEMTNGLETMVRFAIDHVKRIRTEPLATSAQ
ncbi:BPL-N domain-containing protein [Neorhodopirellula pilleata]|nr:BPL-N domain-containing protein [Neorhodopirellula pilleata]